MLPNLTLLAISVFLLLWSSSWLVTSTIQIARYLRWREFVIAFFVMAIVASFPNLFVGVSSALHGIPELSFGDVVGNSVIDLTLVAALAVFFGKGIVAEGKLIQTSSFFTIIIAVLPLLLILDGELGKGDGIVLLFVFALYSIWLFSQRNEYTKILDHTNPVLLDAPVLRFRNFLTNLAKTIVGVALLLVAAEGIVRSVTFFANEFQVPIIIIGILVIGFGNALPEIYFTIASAKRGNSGLVLGNLMGAVIVMATLVLGTVAIISPIKIDDFSPFAIARFFLIVSALFFIIFLRTDRKITRKEGLFLFGLYIAFVIAEILSQV